MKIIELLNLISEGGEPPKKIIVGYETFELVDKEYKKSDDGMNLFECIDLEDLNEEVTIIDDMIEEITFNKQVYQYGMTEHYLNSVDDYEEAINHCIDTICMKINELIRKVNEINLWRNK